MKKLIVFVSTLVVCFTLVACTSSTTYTYTIENGTTVDVTLDTSTGYKIKQGSTENEDGAIDPSSFYIYAPNVKDLSDCAEGSFTFADNEILTDFINVIENDENADGNIYEKQLDENGEIQSFYADYSSFGAASYYEKLEDGLYVCVTGDETSQLKEFVSLLSFKVVD